MKHSPYIHCTYSQSVYTVAFLLWPLLSCRQPNGFSLRRLHNFLPWIDEGLPPTWKLCFGHGQLKTLVSVSTSDHVLGKRGCDVLCLIHGSLSSFLGDLPFLIPPLQGKSQAHVKVLSPGILLYLTGYTSRALYTCGWGFWEVTGL